MDIRKFRTDRRKEQEGVEVPIGEGLTLRVARINNPKAAALWDKLTTNPHTKRALRIDPDGEVATDVFVTLVSEAILRGWSGLTENGQEIPYSREKAKELLRDLPDFRAEVLAIARDQELFREDTMAESIDALKKT